MKEEKHIYVDEKRKEIIDWVKEGRINRFVLNKMYQALFVTLLIASPKGWNVMKDKEARRFLFNKKARIGLLERSIIKNPLYIPANNGSLEKLETKGWGFLGYDFNRTSELGKNMPNKAEGRLYSFLLDEIKDNSKDTYTPTEALRIFVLDDVLSFEKPSIDYLVDNGILEETNYPEAYKKVNLYDQYAKSIDILNLSDEKVYQVTPKGNGLVFLSKDGGSKVKKKSKVMALKPITLPGL